MTPRLTRGKSHGIFAFMKSLPQRIKSYLADNGLSQKDFADYIACHPSQVSRWIRGLRTPSALRRKLIEEFIGK